MKELRALLPDLKGWCFLNYAATAPLLQPAADYFCTLVKQAQEPFSLHRDEWLVLLENARRTVADLIGASTDEIAFVANTSSGLSLIANAIRWKAGDRVLYPAEEFSSNRFVWENLREKGVVPEAISLKNLKQLDLSRVRLLALSAVSYLDGARQPIEEIVRFCHAHGILVAIDAVHSVGVIPVDVKRLQCDFLVCGGQKWLLGPVGTGFIYLKKELIPELFVPQVGWASVHNPLDFASPHFTFAQGARRFEPGLPDVCAIAALATAIKTLSQLGWEKIYARVESLTAQAYEALKETCITPENRAGILTLKTAQAPALQQKLFDKKILVTHHHKHLRLSFHAPLLDEELDYFLDVFGKHTKQASGPAVEPRTPSQKKWALIVGATGTLGSAITAELGSRGYHLFLVARKQEGLEALATALKAKHALEVKIGVFDLTELENFTLNEEIDLLVNCAADATANLFHESDLDQTRKEFEINFWAPLTIVYKVLPSMLAKKRGSILNIITSSARCALPLFSTYAATKGALWAWSEALQRELEEKGIHVTTFLPPHMESPLSTQLSRAAASYYTLPKKRNRASAAAVAQKAVEALEKRKPLVIPWRTRLKLLLNMIFPCMITRGVHKNRQ